MADITDRTEVLKDQKTMNQKRDGRQEVINEGLRILGRTRESYEGKFDDPAFESQFFALSLKKAESLNPNLTMVSGLGGYLETLKGIGSTPGAGSIKASPPTPVLPLEVPSPTPTLGERLGRVAGNLLTGTNPTSTQPVVRGLQGETPQPPTPEQKKEGGDIGAKIGKDIQTAFSTEILDTGLQVVRAIPDVAIGAVSYGDDLLRLLERAAPPSLNLDLNRKNITEPLSKKLDEILGTPKTGTSSVLRGMAGFLIPFTALSKLLPAATTTLGIMGRGIGIDAAVNTFFTDPNQPLIVDMIDQLARDIDPESPESLRASITRYIAGDLGEDQLMKDLVERGIRFGENLPLSVVGEALLASFRFLKEGSSARRTIEGLPSRRINLIDKAGEEIPTTSGGTINQEVKGVGDQLLSPEDLKKVNPSANPEGAFPPPSKEQSFRNVVDRDELVLESRKADQELEVHNERLRVFEEKSQKANIEEASNQEAKKKAIEAREKLRTEKQRADAKAKEIRLRLNESASNSGLSINETTAERAETTALDVAERAAKRRGLTAEASRIKQVKEEALAARMAGKAEREASLPMEGTTFTETTPEIKPSGKASSSKKGKSVGSSKQVEALLDEIGIEEPKVTKGKRPRPPEDVKPTNTKVSKEEAFQEAEVLTSKLDNGGEDLTKEAVDFYELLRGKFGDHNLKAIATVLVKGSIGGLLTEELLNTEPVEANGFDIDPTVRQSALTLFSLGFLGANFKKGAQLYSKLVRAVNPGIESSLKGLKFAPEVRPLRTAEELRLQATKGVPLHLIDDALDLKELISNAEKPPLPIRGSGSIENFKAPRALMTNEELSLKLGAQPETIDSARNGLTPEAFTKRASALLDIAEQLPLQLKSLAKRHLNGEPVGREMMKAFNIAGQIGNGFNTEGPQFAKNMNRFRELPDGAFAYKNIGKGMQADAVAGWIEKLSPEQIMAAAYGSVNSSIGGSLSEAFINVALAGVGTPYKVFTGNVTQLILDASDTFGAAVLPRLPIIGELLTGGVNSTTPELAEFGILLKSHFANTLTGLRLGATTALTGETSFVEPAASLGRPSRVPNITRNNHILTGAALDRVGGLVGFPNAGNIIDYMGSAIRGIGGRLLLAADEVTSYLQEAGTKQILAHRAAQNGKTALERKELYEAFLNNPGEEATAFIRGKKEYASLMQSLSEDNGGFQTLRKYAAAAQEAASESPFWRTMVPFLKSMTNVLDGTLERTFDSNLRLLSSSFLDQLKSPNPYIAADAQGRVFTSFAIVSLAALGGVTGLITGPLSFDKEIKEQLERADRVADSINPGKGIHLGLDKGGVLGGAVRVAASIASMASSEVTEQETNGAAAAILGIAESLKNNTVFGRFAEFFHDFDNNSLSAKIKDRGLETTVLNSLDDIYLKPFVSPRILNDMQKVMDPYRRVWDTYEEKLMSRTPGLSKDLPIETDVVGRKRFLGGGLTDTSVNSAIRVFQGVPSGQIKEDALSKTLIKKNVLIHEPQRVITISGVSIPITRKEMQEVKDIANNIPGHPSLYQELLDISKTPLWKDLTKGPEGTAQLVVSKRIEARIAAAKRVFVSKNPEVFKRLNDKLLELKGLEK